MRDNRGGMTVVASANFESGPPASKSVVPTGDGEVMEVVKEEEWEERKKKTTKTTRNIEKRVQRQLVLEDGEIKEDSGPITTEDATEDTVVHEEQTDESQRPQGQIEGPPGDGWVPVPGGLVVSEKCTKTINSHDELEDELETEEIQHCGDITNQEAEDYVVGKNDIRSLVSHRKSRGLELAKPEKRVVHEAKRRRGNIDTVDVRETSRIQDGHVVTEKEKTVEREEYDNESAPDSGSSISDGSVHEKTKDTSHNLVHTKDEDLLEYYAVPKGKSLSQGVKIGEGMHVVSEDVHEDREGGEIEPLTEKYKREGRKTQRKSLTKERTDAITRRPLDFEEEEETRKSETNRWLENHFGSESGRSATSSQDLNDIQEGGNRITITMSPRPAVAEEFSGSIPSPSHRWKENYHSTPKVPPPPPPKPGRLWNQNSLSTPPTSLSSPPMSPTSPHDIHESELTAARARLRNTGVRLIDEEKENISYEANVSPRAQKESTFFTSEQKRSFFPSSKYSSDIVEPVYSSRFSSGVPSKNYRNSPSPPPLRSHSPTANVGRSQSFNVSTLPIPSRTKKKKSPERESRSGRSFFRKKEHRSVEQLDNVHQKPSVAKRLFGRLSPSKDLMRYVRTLSPKRDKTPPPPPRSSKTTFEEDIFASSYGREAATQTGPSPVPPPRTRKKKPRNTYFFGQEDASSSSPYQNGYSSTASSERKPWKNSHAVDRNYSERKRDHYHKDHNLINERHRNHYPKDNSSMNERTRTHYPNDNSPVNERRRHHYTKDNSPVNERRRSHYPKDNSSIGETKYRTTHTITLPHKTVQVKSTSNQNPDDEMRSTWTNTVDPRRKSRSPSYNDKYSTTLPRKLGDYYSYPKKQYFYGEENETKERDRERYRSYKSSDYKSYPETNSSRSPGLDDTRTKAVGRSHSFNIRPAGNVHIPPTYNTTGRSLAEHKKTSSVYSSSPYLNLRSPNLIATIARSNSIRNLETEEPQHKQDDTKTQFMEGLLNTAPELFHFIHGEDKHKGGHQNERHESYRRSTSNLDTSSPSSPPAKVFTFGKSDNALTRSGSGGSFTNKRNTKTGSLINLNTPPNTLPKSDRKTSFNLKTSGSSLLYSPSFRERQKKEEWLASRGYKSRLSNEYSSPGLSKGIQDESPTLSHARDWNKR